MVRDPAPKERDEGVVEGVIFCVESFQKTGTQLKERKKKAKQINFNNIVLIIVITMWTMIEQNIVNCIMFLGYKLFDANKQAHKTVN